MIKEKRLRQYILRLKIGTEIRDQRDVTCYNYKAKGHIGRRKLIISICIELCLKVFVPNMIPLIETIRALILEARLIAYDL